MERQASVALAGFCRSRRHLLLAQASIARQHLSLSARALLTRDCVSERPQYSHWLVSDGRPPLILSRERRHGNSPLFSAVSLEENDVEVVHVWAEGAGGGGDRELEVGFAVGGDWGEEGVEH